MPKKMTIFASNSVAMTPPSAYDPPLKQSFFEHNLALYRIDQLN